MSAGAPKVLGVKSRRKLARARRRDEMAPVYREACRAEIKAMRQRNAPADEFRTVLKQLKRDFSRFVAGRKAVGS